MGSQSPVTCALTDMRQAKGFVSCPLDHFEYGSLPGRALVDHVLPVSHVPFLPWLLFRLSFPTCSVEPRYPKVELFGSLVTWEN